MKKTPHDLGALQPLRNETLPAPEDARMAALFGQVDPLDPLSEITALRIRRGLERTIDARESRRFPVWLQGAVAAAAALFLLETAAAAAIASWPAARHRIFGTAAKARVEAGSVVAAPGPSVALPPTAAAPGIAPTTELAIPTETRALAPAFHSVSRPQRLRQTQPLMSAPPLGATAPAATPAVVATAAPVVAKIAAPPADDPDVTLYTQALSQLNVQHNAAAALQTLQAYRARHPGGLFENEAEVAEVRAHLMMGNQSEALSLLDAMQSRGFGGVPQASELRLLRGELLELDGRCEEAVAALAPYIEGSAGSALASAAGSDRERALYSRAACRARLGDDDGSEQDLRVYLRDFPRGRFAARVRQELARYPGVAE